MRSYGYEQNKVINNVGEYGKKWKIFFVNLSPQTKSKTVAYYIGEYECNLDNKSRLMIPARLMKQIPLEFQEKFVVARSLFAKCLVLFPMDAWEENMQKIKKLNPNRKDVDTFIRHYLNGATEVELDNSKRILLPKKQLEFASIDKEIVITSSVNKFEVWAAHQHPAKLAEISDKQYEDLAEDLLGNQD